MYFYKKLTTSNLNIIFNDIIVVFPLFLMLDISFVIDILSIIILVLALLKIKQDGFKISFWDKYIFIFLLTLIISFIFAPYSITKGVKEIRDIIEWIFFPLILGQFIITDKTKRYILYFIFMGGIIYLTRFYFQKLGLISMNGTTRFSGGYMISQISLILAVLFISLLILFFYKKIFLKEKVLVFLSIILLLLMILMTRTRGIYLAILITIQLIVLIRNLEYFFITILLTSIFIVILVFSFSNNKYVKRFKSIENIHSSSGGRLEVWKESIRIFKTSPINGIGYMNFKKAQRDRKYKAYLDTVKASFKLFKKAPWDYKKYLNFKKNYLTKSAYKYNQYYAHSHSMIFKMLCETGVIGLFGYLLLNLTLLFKSIKKGKTDINYLMIFGILMILLLYELTEVLIWRNFGYPFIYFAFGVLLNNEYVKVFPKKA